MAKVNDKKETENVDKPTAKAAKKHLLDGIKYSRTIRTGADDLPVYGTIAYSVNRGGSMVRTKADVRYLVENPIKSLKENPNWAGVRFVVTDEQMDFISATSYGELSRIEKQLKSK